jgi:hypothetical protein
MKTPEQLGPRANRRGGGASVWLKRLAHRIMRRATKRDPENAPRKNRFFGFFW